MSSGMTLEKIQLKIEAETKGAREEIEKVNKKVREMSSNTTKEVNKVNSTFKSLLEGINFSDGVKQIGEFVKSSTQMAVKVEGSIQQIKRTMGESSNEFLKWSKDNALAFNMSQSDVANYGASYSSIVSTFATDTNQAMSHTTGLLKANSIIASSTGRDMEDVQNRIKSALLGNTKGIEELGIDVSVAMLESTDAFKKFANGKPWDELSLQTQQQIMQFGILEQTTNKFGTEVASNTSSNLQQLGAILKDVSLNIGNAFLPILDVVLPILNDFATGLKCITEYIAPFIEGLINNFGSISEPIKASFENLMDSVGPIIDTIGQNIMWFLDEILLPLGSWAISDLIPAFFDLLAGAFDILNPILEVFRELGMWLWDSFLQPIAEWTGGIIVEVLTGLADILSDLGTWMSENEEVIKNITFAVLAFFAAWEVTKLLSFIATTGGLIGSLGILAASIWACTGAKLASKVETVILTAMYAQDTIIKWANVAAQVACTIATTAWNVICGIATVVTTAFGAAMTFLTSPIGLVILAIAAVVAIGILLYQNWETIMTYAGRMGEVVMGVFGAIGGFVGDVFKGIINGFIGVVNFCISGIEKLIQGFIIPLNALIGGWNMTIGLVAGEIDPIKVSIPRVSYLAKGGVVNSATLAVVGEAGKEAVMPLENNTGWISLLADKLTSRMPTRSSDDNYNGDLTLMIDGSVIGKVALNQLRKMQRQGGITLIPT